MANSSLAFRQGSLLRACITRGGEHNSSDARNYKTLIVAHGSKLTENRTHGICKDNIILASISSCGTSEALDQAKMHLTSLPVLVSFLMGWTVLASPVYPDIQSGTLPLPSRTIFQFSSNGTWIENIAVRANGDLLVTLMLPDPQLYLISSPWSPSPTASLLYTFPNMTGLFGIAETSPDVFVLAGGGFNSGTVAGIQGHSRSGKLTSTPLGRAIPARMNSQSSGRSPTYLKPHSLTD